MTEQMLMVKDRRLLLTITLLNFWTIYLPQQLQHFLLQLSLKYKNYILKSVK